MASAILLAALLAAAGPAAPASVAPVAPAVPETKVPAAPAAPAGAGEKPAGHAAALPPEADKVDPRAERLPSKPPTDKAAPEKTAEERPSRPMSGALPPSLTARALLDELRRSARDRTAAQSSLGEQRQKLEVLQKEIEASRAAMRDETKRLQELVAAAAMADRRDGSKKGKDSALDTLAKTVRGMKADAAAALLARLDRGLAAGILGRMRPADAALVLDKMEPAASASLVSLLAGRDRT